MSSWYRNVGRTTKYHKAAPDWVKSGKAVCGEDIKRPAYVIDTRKNEPYRSDSPFCKHCKGK